MYEKERQFSIFVSENVEAKYFQQDDEREGEAEKGAEGGRGQYFGLHQPQLST